MSTEGRHKKNEIARRDKAEEKRRRRIQRRRDKKKNLAESLPQAKGKALTPVDLDRRLVTRV